MQCKVEEGYKASPYPALDEFMLTQINNGGIQGVIRRWLHFVSSNLMLYDVGRNHFCQNIGRPHKSNHIYYIVDMKRGIFYQKCHDPECVDFKSEEIDLPENVNPFLNESDYLIDDFEESSRILCDAVEIAECGESFALDEFNEPMAILEDDLCTKSEMPAIENCENVTDNVLFDSEFERGNFISDFALDKVEGNREVEKNASDFENCLDSVEGNFDFDGKSLSELAKIGISRKSARNINEVIGKNENSSDSKSFENKICGANETDSRRHFETLSTEKDLESLENIDFEEPILSQGFGPAPTVKTPERESSSDSNCPEKVHEENLLFTNRFRSNEDEFEGDSLLHDPGFVSCSLGKKCKLENSREKLNLESSTPVFNNRSEGIKELLLPENSVSKHRTEPLKTNQSYGYRESSSLSCTNDLFTSNFSIIRASDDDDEEIRNKDMNNDRAFVDYLEKDKKFGINYSEHIHHWNHSTPFNRKEDTLNMSSVRCELSEFDLDDDLDEELLKMN